MDLSLSEQICYSTIRIETQTNKGCCTGTGFFFNFLENPDNKTHIPCIVTNKHVVEEGTTYDYLTIENDNSYLSPDNQYIKTTPLTTEVYVKSGSLSASQFYKNLKAFISGETA